MLSSPRTLSVNITRPEGLSTHAMEGTSTRISSEYAPGRYRCCDPQLRLRFREHAPLVLARTAFPCVIASSFAHLLPHQHAIQHRPAHPRVQAAAERRRRGRRGRGNFDTGVITDVTKGELAGSCIPTVYPEHHQGRRPAQVAQGESANREYNIAAVVRAVAR